MRVFVLGAGFSIPAGLPSASALTRLAIDSATSGDDELREWVDGFLLFTRWNYAQIDVAGYPGIEDFFHHAAFLSEVYRLRQHTVPVGRGDGPWTPWKRAEDWDFALARVMRGIVTVLWDRQQSAIDEPVDRFVKHLREDDVVVTFNYDTLVEEALTRMQRPWTHGFDKEGDGFRVIKLHGSIDWIMGPRGKTPRQHANVIFTKSNTNRSSTDDVCGDREDDWELARITDMTKHLSEMQNGDLDSLTFGLANLGMYKRLHEVVGLGESWASAGNAITAAKELTFVGFSMSDFDTMAQLVIGNALRGRIGRPIRIRVIDPNYGDRSFVPRYQRVCENLDESIHSEREASVEFTCAQHEKYDWSSH